MLGGRSERGLGVEHAPSDGKQAPAPRASQHDSIPVHVTVERHRFPQRTGFPDFTLFHPGYPRFPSSPYATKNRSDLGGVQCERVCEDFRRLCFQRNATALSRTRGRENQTALHTSISSSSRVRSTAGSDCLSCSGDVAPTSGEVTSGWASTQAMAT